MSISLDEWNELTEEEKKEQCSAQSLKEELNLRLEEYNVDASIEAHCNMIDANLCEITLGNTKVKRPLLEVMNKILSLPEYGKINHIIKALS